MTNQLRAFVAPVTTLNFAGYLEGWKAFGIVTNSNDINDRIMKLTRSESINIKNGKYKEFNKHAVLIAEGFYLNNVKHGEWKEYYDHSGSLMIEEQYLNGLNHGRFASYHPNGKMLSEGNYAYGVREGYFQIFDEHGKKIRTMLFINNHLIEDIDLT